MAGSYNHIVDDYGNLVSNETFSGMIENLGDAYEMTEEMFGMIWFLAHQAVAAHVHPESLASFQYAREMIKDVIQISRQNYPEGLSIAKEVNRLR